MSTTAQQILDEALQRSDLNDSALIPSAQALRWMSNFERAVFLRSARLNPNYFGTNATTSVRASATATWNLAATPGNVAAVTRLSVAAIVGTPTPTVGAEVRLIDMRWPEVHIAPRVYMRGRVLSPYGTDLGTGGNYVSQLTLYYTPLSSQLTTLSQNLMVPDEWTDLVTLPLARLMATRDGRLQEAQVIESEFQQALALFDQSMLVLDHGTTRPLGAIPAFPPPIPQG